VRKVRVVLAERGVPYDHEPVMPGNPDPEYRKMSPLGKIPAWRDGDRALSDSSVICQYLAHAGVHVDGTRWPKLAKYVATHHERPSFAPIIGEEKAFFGLA
jgi:glutathione S-transferase